MLLVLSPMEFPKKSFGQRLKSAFLTLGLPISIAVIIPVFIVLLGQAAAPTEASSKLDEGIGIKSFLVATQGGIIAGIVAEFIFRASVRDVHVHVRLLFHKISAPLSLYLFSLWVSLISAALALRPVFKTLLGLSYNLDGLLLLPCVLLIGFFVGARLTNYFFPYHEQENDTTANKHRE